MKPIIFPVLVLALTAVVFVLAFGPPPANRNESPLSTRSPELVFAVVGDTESHATVYQRVLEEATRRGAQFVLHTGDITEQGTNDEFTAMRALENASGLNIQAAVGSHDIRTDETRGLFRQFYAHENRAVDLGGYRFVFLDNADRSIGFAPATLAWLKDELAQHSTTRYIIAFHRPFNLPLQSFIGDDEAPTSRRSNEKFLALLAEARVLGMFTGHLHLYLPYKIKTWPVYVTGGGGGEPQTALGSLGQQPKHFLLVRLRGEDLRVEVVRLN